MKAVQTEGCLNVTWSFPIILIHECFHNNMSYINITISTISAISTWDINITDIQNGKQALMFTFCISAFILYIFVSVSPFEWRIYTIDSCWNRQLIPLTHAQNAHVSLPSAVVCAVCSRTAFWSGAADTRRQHRRLSSPLGFWSWLGASRPLD